MVGLGGAMILISILGLYWNWRGTLANKKTFLKLMVASIFFPFLANTFGWVMSEIGRQPWIVNGLMKTAEAVSPNVSAGSVLFSLITFSLVYTLLAIAMVTLFIKVIKQGPYEKQKKDINTIDPFSTGGLKNAAK